MKHLTALFAIATLWLQPARAAAPGDADFPAPSPSGRHDEKVAAVKAGKFELLMVGDSITHCVGEIGGKYEPLKSVWEKYYAPRKAINLGYSGYRTEQILWHLQNGELDLAEAPKAAVVLIGTNNTDERHFKTVHTPEQIFAGTKAIVEEIRKRHPSTKILVLRIFPRGGDSEQGTGDGIFHASAECIERGRKAGELTAQLADGEHVFWLDVGRRFLRADGTINPDLMPDLLHPNAAGAEVWAQSVCEAVDQITGKQPLKIGARTTLNADGKPEDLQNLPIWSKEAPNGDGTVHPGNVFCQVILPAKPNGAAVVICPGGGYGGLVTGGEGTGIAEWLNQHGVTGVVLKYRLPATKYSMAPLLDAQRTIRLVRSRAFSWGIDPKRVGIMGFSAGGHLASTAATHFDAGKPEAADLVERQSCRPDFAVLVYPVISMGEKGHAGSRHNLLGPNPEPDQIKFFSGELNVTAETCPVYLTHAVDDHVVSIDNSRMFYQALQAAKVPSKLLELPSGDHGLNGYKGPMWDAWQTGSLEWLDGLKVIPEGSAK
jgi:acetyl esterase/lipase/lysophospholipase L1-like esterase